MEQRRFIWTLSRSRRTPGGLPDIPPRRFQIGAIPGTFKILLGGRIDSIFDFERLSKIDCLVEPEFTKDGSVTAS